MRSYSSDRSGGLSQQKLNRLFVLIIISGFAVSLTPFCLLLYDARESLWGQWQAIEAELLEWFYLSLGSAQNQALSFYSGQTLLKRPSAEKAVSLAKLSEQNVNERQSSLPLLGSQGNPETPSRQVTIQVAEAPKTLSHSSVQSLSPSFQSLAKDESDLRQSLTQAKYHRDITTEQVSTVTVTIDSSSSKPAESPAKRSNPARSVLVTQALPPVKPLGKASDLRPVPLGTLEQTSSLPLPSSLQAVTPGPPPALMVADARLAPFAVSSVPETSPSFNPPINFQNPPEIAQVQRQETVILADTRLAPFTVSAAPENLAEFELPENAPESTTPEIVPPEIAQVNPPTLLLADTRLAPFTISAVPEEITTFNTPNNSPTQDKEQTEIAQIQRQENLILADTRLAPFNVSVAPENLTDFELPANQSQPTSQENAPQNIAQLNPPTLLLADTRLAPFTISAAPEEITTFNTPNNSPTQDKEQTEVAQIQRRENLILADTRLVPFTVSVAPENLTDFELPANQSQTTSQEDAPQNIAQLNPPTLLLADTRLAPFTISAAPEEITTFNTPNNSPTQDKEQTEIAQIQRQETIILADTRLAPFTVSVASDDTTRYLDFLNNVATPVNNPTSAPPATTSPTPANQFPDTDLSAVAVPVELLNNQFQGTLQPLTTPPAPMAIAQGPNVPLISQGGSTERNLTPTTPTPTLEQENAPEPTEQLPTNLPTFQEPTEATTPKQDLFAPYAPDNLDTQQIFTNTQLVDIFQDLNLTNYYDTTIGPLVEAVQALPGAQPEGTIAQQQDKMMERALSNTSLRYPWITNSSDNLSFAPLLFRPKDNQFYFNLDLRFSEPNPVVNQITFGAFPYDDQFYWLLDQNRVVIETFGAQGGIIYQGKEQSIKIEQTLIQSQSLTAYQAVWVIPYDLQRLFKPEELTKFSIISIGGQLINPDGTTAGSVNIDSSSITDKATKIVNLSERSVSVPDPSQNVDRIGIASTFNPNGGGSLFGNLRVENAPLILQAFPTTDLRPLAGIELKRGTVIPRDKLEAAGIFFGDLNKGTPAKFTAPVTSVPGIKTAQIGQFDNPDLLKILVNPYLSNWERDYSYLNSFQWLSSGSLPPQVFTRTLERTYQDWYRVFFSIPHNRVMLQYSTYASEATFMSLYSSPGVSFTFPYDGGNLDGTQTLNSSLGMVMGWIFDALNLEDMDESLDRAKEERDQEKLFAPLKTQMSPQERKQINQRLNTNLAYATLGSSLNQVSGFVTFPAVIRPTESSIFQIKTGNIQRAVQFVGSDIGPWEEGETTIANVRLSGREFGPLTFLGSTLPVSPTFVENGSATGVNQVTAGGQVAGAESGFILSDEEQKAAREQQEKSQSIASRSILIAPDGTQYIKDFNPYDITEIPTTIRSYAVAFDRMLLQRQDRRVIDTHYYNGYLYLPTIEFVYAGTSEDLNYTINTGVWFNTDNWSAPGVTYNSLGLYEPWVGVYTNAVVSGTFTDFELDDNNQIEAIASHVPLLRFNWNSANNGNNPWQVSLSYTYSRQTRSYGASLTAGLGYIPQYGNGPVIGLFYGKFGLPFGLSGTFNVELGDQTYYNVNLLQKVWENFSLGPYASNYVEINQGFNSRELLFNYGGIVQHQFPDSPVTMTAQIGTGDTGTIATIKGGIRF